MLVFLVYHKIWDVSNSDIYTISHETFVAHLRMVSTSGIAVVNPRALFEERDAPNHGIVFTFDDGTSDHFDTVYPLLRDFGISALFYISTSRIGRDGYLTQGQLRRLYEGGHTIGSHAHFHRRMDCIPESLVAQELHLSLKIISNLVGERPIHFAPPGGRYNRMVVQAAQRVGYQFFRTMRWGYNRSFNPLCIEVVPMAGIMSFRFLKHVLHDEGEWLLKLAFYLKSGVRAVFPNISKVRGLTG